MTHQDDVHERAQRAAPADSMDRDVILSRVRAALIDPATPPVRIGRFEVIARLGTGGMGAVYSAYDRELDRKVAIKLLHDTADVEGRLTHEAQVLARLRHPNIVGVFEVGVDERGDRYVVMELVAGSDLAAWQAAAPRDWSLVLDVFLAAGRGLAAAHAAGIVHSDFKPANVLVASTAATPPDVRVADFGLAHASIPTRGASVGRGGTPAYAAPEVLRGEAPGPAADQYGFGVALRQALADARPSPPRAIMRRLDRILARSSADAPADRWPDVDALLVALHGAVRPSRVSLVLGVAGVLAFTALAAVDRGPQSECDDSVDLVREWRDVGEPAVREAFAALDHPAGAMSAAFALERMDGLAAAIASRKAELCATQAASDPERQHQRRCLAEAQLVFETTVTRLIAIDALSFSRLSTMLPTLAVAQGCDDAEAFAEETAPIDEAAVHELLAELYAADAHGDRGQWGEARDRLLEIVARARALDHAPTTARVLVTLARAHHRAGDDGEAIAAARDAVVEADRGRADGPRSKALEFLTYRLADAGDFAGAREAMRLVDAVEERHSAADSERTLLATLRRAHVERLATGPEAGLAHQRRALELVDADPRLPPELRAEVLVGLGRIELEMMRLADARAHLEQALAVYEPMLGADHPELGAVWMNLGTCDVRDGALDRAQAAFERVLAIRSRVVPADSPSLAAPLHNLAAVRFNRGRYAEALEAFERVLALRLAQWGPDHPELAKVLGSISFCHGRLGAHEAALAAAKRALDIRTRALGEDHPDTGKSHVAVAIAARRNRDDTVARTHFEQAIAIARTADGMPELYEPLAGLAELLADTGDHEAVVRLVRPALAGCRAREGIATICGVLEFQLARATVIGDRDAAIAAAEKARAELATADNDPEMLARIDRWLAAQR